MNVQNFFDALIDRVTEYTKFHDPNSWSDFGYGPEYLRPRGVDLPLHPMMLEPLDGKKLIEIDRLYDDIDVTVIWAIVFENNTNNVSTVTGKVDGAIAYIDITGAYGDCGETNFHPEGGKYLVTEVKPTAVTVIKYFSIN